ncbi:MAG: BMC domain-containing protein [Marinisporobacter sp.]|nr:BMC domain-containing protein [Marinisporobacter sp.]
MSKLALGIIETVGLAAAIEAADTAAKSANIKVIGYELTKGDGMATVKIEGSVGAVKAAINAAVINASKVSKVWGNLVIPRPSDGLKMLVYNDETVGIEKKEDEEQLETIRSSHMEEKDLKNMPIEDMENHEKAIEENMENIEQDNRYIQEDHEDIEIDEETSSETDICNICKDPKCPRKKGDLRKICIHYEELKKEGRFNK